MPRFFYDMQNKGVFASHNRFGAGWACDVTTLDQRRERCKIVCGCDQARIADNRTTNLYRTREMELNKDVLATVFATLIEDENLSTLAASTLDDTEIFQFAMTMYMNNFKEKTTKTGGMRDHETLLQLEDTRFHKLFRMQKDTFSELCNVVRPFYPIKSVSGDNPQVCLEKAVLMTLYYLSHQNSMSDIADFFNVSSSTVSEETSKITDILCEIRQNYIKWPEEEECQVIANQFYDRGRLPGVVGAIDGCHIQCMVPTEHQDSYTDRKFNHSIILQGICTATKIFTNISVGTPGRRHDVTALRNSAFHNRILEYGPEPLFYNDHYHLVGDSAYPCRSWLVPPYKINAGVTAQQRRFNYHQSTTRIVIEHTFGLLKGRWRRLLNVNVRDIGKASNIVVACCVLHNFCYIRKDYAITETVNDDEIDRVRNRFVEDSPEEKEKGVRKRDNLASMF